MTPWWWWSWLLAAVGVTGLWLAGRDNKTGWVIGLAAQLLWLAYAITTRQWGFLVTAFAYGIVYARNWHRWHQRERILRKQQRERDLREQTINPDR